MEKTTMAAAMTGLIATAAVLGMVIIGTNAAQVEGTKQLTSCVEAGGSYLVNDGNPLCIMPGQDLPER
jgi:hypothetical protein